MKTNVGLVGFGNGAIFVAKNLKDLGEGRYTFEDILKPYFQF